MLIDTKSARLLRFCGAEEFLDFEHMDQYRTRDARRSHLPLSVQYGALLSSPVADVTARVWRYVVRQFLLNSEEPAKVIAQAMTGDGFAEPHPDDLPDRVSTCGACNDMVIDGRNHQQSSRRCQTAAAATA